MRIYLDNCCYNRPYDGQEQVAIQAEANAKLFIQSLAKRGIIKLFSSFVLVEEVRATPSDVRRNNIMAFINANSSGYVAADKLDILKATAGVIMKTGVKPKDAAHVACAILAQCEYFITTDKRLLRYKSDKITLVNPIDFVKIWRENNV